MMTEHSLRPMTLVFKIQLIFDATFTLDCSRFIGFCRKFLLDFFSSPERTFIHFRAELLRWIAAFSRRLIFEWRDFRLPLSTQNSFIKILEERFFTLDTQHAHRNFFWIVRENSCSNFFPRPLILISHSTFWHQIFSTTFAQSHFRRYNQPLSRV